MKSSLRTFTLALFLIALVISPLTVTAQVGGNDRDMAIGMLDMTKDAIKKNYYDPTFHGVDLDYVFEQAKERMKAAQTRDAMLMAIAAAVMALDDSHTKFYPPARAASVDYGWQVRVINDDAYISRVKPGSDAEAQGVKPGDKLLAIDGFKPTRKNLWQMYYRYFWIAPTARVNMTLLSPGAEKPRVVPVSTKIEKRAGLVTIQTLYERGTVRDGWFDSEKVSEFQQFGDELLIWKMHTFSMSNSNLDSAMAKARGVKTLVLDLRENGGGSVDILKRMIGYFFDKEIKIGDERRRKETKALVAKPNKEIFSGNLIVLVSQESASASEIFSKIVQLEKRGKIIGDRTSGAVMESKYHQLDSGFGNNLYFGASVTMADLIMTDGKSLEKLGVAPDETVLPTGKDMAEGKDPVLAYAAKLAGVEISPEKAGTFFPYEWPKQ